MGILEGKAAVVTGGGRGIGRGHCVHLAGNGAAVVVNDVDPEEAGVVVDEITQQGGKSNCFLYTYKCGDRYTSSFFSQQACVFINGLLGRDASAAMIRFYVQAGPQGIDTSQQFVRQAAQALLPKIHRSLNQSGPIASITTTPVALDR